MGKRRDCEERMNITHLEEKKTNLAKYEGNKPVGKAGTLKDLLEQFKPQLLQVIPKHVSPERLMKTAMAAMSRTPKLLQCTQASVIKSIMTSAELGLDCSGTLGDAYLVPFKNKGTMEAQLIVGYRGLARLARQSGEIKRIEAELVYEKDHFVFSKGTDFKLEFSPRLDGDRGKFRGAYALAEFKDGGVQAEWMTLEDLNKIKARSKAKDFGPWVTDEGEMRRKTVFRRLSKWLPLSADSSFTAAVAADNEGSIEAEFEVVGESDEGIESHAEIAQQPEETKADAAVRAMKQGKAAEAEKGIEKELDPNVDIVSMKILGMKKTALAKYAEQIGMEVDGRWSLPKLQRLTVEFKKAQLRGEEPAPVEQSIMESTGMPADFPEPDEPNFEVLDPADAEAIAGQVKTFADKNGIPSRKVWARFERECTATLGIEPDTDLDDIPAEHTEHLYGLLANKILVDDYS